MRRVGIPRVQPNIYAGTKRVVLEIGHDHYSLTAEEAIAAADLLVDAAETLTRRLENSDG